MLAVNEDGRFPHGAMAKICAKLSVARSTLWRLWKRCHASRAAGRVLMVDCFSRKKKVTPERYVDSKKTRIQLNTDLSPPVCHR